MNDRSRWLHSSSNSELRELLEPALRDAPPPAALRRVASSIGLGSALAPTLTNAALGASNGAAGSKLVFGSASALVWKWFGVGALAGGVVSSAHVVATRPDSSSVPAAPAVASYRAAQAPRPLAPPITPRAELRPIPHDETMPAPSAPAPAKSPVFGRSARRVAASAEAPRETRPALPSSGDMARETAAIDEARRAFARQDAAAADRALRDYESVRRFGVLDREALVLAIEVAIARGETLRARSLATRFRAAYPRDVHLVHLEPLLQP